MVLNRDFQIPQDNFPAPEALFSWYTTKDQTNSFFTDELNRLSVSKEFNIPVTPRNKLPNSLIKSEFETRTEVARSANAFHGLNAIFAIIDVLCLEELSQQVKVVVSGIIPDVTYWFANSLNSWLRAKLALRRAVLVSSPAEEVTTLLSSNPFQNSLFGQVEVEQVKGKLSQLNSSFVALVVSDSPVASISRPSSNFSKARAIQRKYNKYVNNKARSTGGLSSFSRFAADSRNSSSRTRGRVGKFYKGRGKGRGKSFSSESQQPFRSGPSSANFIPTPSTSFARGSRGSKGSRGAKSSRKSFN